MIGRRHARAALTLAFVPALSLVLACSRKGDPAWRAEFAAWRDGRDAHFRSAEGPLPEAERSVFTGLRYFDPDPSWNVVAVLEPAAAADTVALVTSKGTHDRLLRVGRARFERDGHTHSLLVFQSLQTPELFVPFTDLTTGRETYGAGRYVEPQPEADGRLRIDFNRAYNPYCAYDARWICPIPPAENRLAVRVAAGEKSFDEH